MQVKDLIVALQRQPQNAEVQMEGCDCYTDPSGEFYEYDFQDKHYVVIKNNIEPV